MNLSPAQTVSTGRLVELVSGIVHRHQTDACRLKIELTESTILDQVQRTREKMHQGKKRGIAFSMDDFGTGYSSRAYLQRLPLNQHHCLAFQGFLFSRPVPSLPAQ